MKRPMAWVGLSFFSALILFCIYGLWAAIAGGLVSLCLLLLFLCIPRVRRERLLEAVCLSVLAASLLIGAQTKLVLEPVESFAGKTLPITAQVVSLTESRNGRHYTILLVTKAGGEKVRFRLRYSGKTPLPAEPYDTVEATLRIDALGESEAARRSYRAKGIFLRGSTYEPITGDAARKCFSCLPPAGNAQRDAGCSQSVFARGRREAPGRDAAGGDGSCFGNCHPEFSYLRRFTSAGCIGPAYVVVGDVPFSHAAKAKMEPPCVGCLLDGICPVFHGAGRFFPVCHAGRDHDAFISGWFSLAAGAGFP